MCRMILMIGNFSKNKYIIEFLNQSIKKKNTPFLNSKLDVDYHKDGFGLLWKNRQDKINIYKKPFSFDKDENIDEIINKIDSNLFIGHIRAVCPNKIKVCLKNTHPFIDNDEIWCHNGSINNFNQFKNEIEKKYINKINKKMIGQTDSEFLFHFFKLLKIKNEDSEIDNLIKTIIIFFSYLNKKNYKVSGNIIYSNNNYAFISRYINNNQSGPSLYNNTVENSIMISSEPILDNYSLFPNNYIKIYDLKKNKKVAEFKLNKS